MREIALAGSRVTTSTAGYGVVSRAGKVVEGGGEIRLEGDRFPEVRDRLRQASRAQQGQAENMMRRRIVGVGRIASRSVAMAAAGCPSLMSYAPRCRYAIALT